MEELCTLMVVQLFTKAKKVTESKEECTAP